MEDLSQILAKNLRLARAIRGLSQEDLADLCGLDRTYVSGVERAVRNPTIKVVARLAEGLGIAAHELLQEKAGLSMMGKTPSQSESR